MTTKHTPTPWRIASNTEIWSCDQPVLSIAHEENSNLSAEEADANQAFIVRACNAHEELLEALKHIASMSTGDGLDYCRPLTQNDKMTLRETANQAAVIRCCFLSIEGIAKAAIAKAEGKE